MNHLRAKFSSVGGVDWIEISNLGDKYSILKRKVRPGDAQQFPQAWAAFKEGRAQDQADGTPLEEVDGVTPDLAAKYRAKKVRTAEELAGLSDAAVRGLGIMGAQGHRKAAQALIAADDEEAA